MIKKNQSFQIPILKQKKSKIINKNFKNFSKTLRMGC